MVDDILNQLKTILSNRYTGQIDESTCSEDEKELVNVINTLLSTIRDEKHASIKFKADLLTDIDALSQVLEKISLGHFDAEVADRRLSEMDTMQIGVEDMAKRIRKYQESLQQKVEEQERDKENLRIAHDALRKSEENYRKLSDELTHGLVDVFDALRKISLGDPEIRIPETSNIALLKELKRLRSTYQIWYRFHTNVQWGFLNSLGPFTG